MCTERKVTILELFLQYVDWEQVGQGKRKRYEGKKGTENREFAIWLTQTEI